MNEELFYFIQQKLDGKQTNKVDGVTVSLTSEALTITSNGITYTIHPASLDTTTDRGEAWVMTNAEIMDLFNVKTQTTIQPTTTQPPTTTKIFGKLSKRFSR